MKMQLHFDVRTFIGTTLVLPAAYYVLRHIRRLLKDSFVPLVEGIAWHVARPLNHKVAAYVNLRRYSRTQMKSDWSQYLYVPGKGQRKTVKIDDVFIPLALNTNIFGTDRFTAESMLGA